MKRESFPTCIHSVTGKKASHDSYTHRPYKKQLSKKIESAKNYVILPRNTKANQPLQLKMQLRPCRYAHDQCLDAFPTPMPPQQTVSLIESRVSCNQDNRHAIVSQHPDSPRIHH